MPRLKPRPDEARHTRFRAAVSHQMIMYGIDSQEDLSKRCGITHTTFYRRMKDPETFTNGELRKIYNVLHFTDEQRLILCK
jgi:hypothetical protein